MVRDSAGAFAQSIQPIQPIRLSLDQPRIAREFPMRDPEMTSRFRSASEQEQALTELLVNISGRLIGLRVLPFEGTLSLESLAHSPELSLRPGDAPAGDPYRFG